MSKDDWKYICSFCEKKDNDETTKSIWVAPGAPFTGARICDSCVTRIYAELIRKENQELLAKSANATIGIH